MNANRTTHNHSTTKTHRTTTITRSLVCGLALLPLLTACGDRQKKQTPSPSTISSAQQPPSSETQPSVGSDVASTTGVTPAVSTQPPSPPTPEETKIAWGEGVKLYESGDFEGACTQLEVASAGRPDDAYVHYLLGLSRWKAGHLEESEKALVRSSEINDRSARTFVNLARVRLERKDSQGALDAADKALVIEPGSSQALHQRGRALDGLKRGDEARDTLQQARQADPGNGYIANSLGYLLLRQGRTDEAIVELEAARAALPGVAYVRNNLGVAYEKKGDVEKAVAEFQAAVEAGDSDGKAAESLARLEPVMERILARRPVPPTTPSPEVAVADGDGQEAPHN